MKEAISAAVAVGLTLAGTARAEDRPLYPRVAQTNHTSPETARLMEAFFTAKSKHNVEKTMSYFSPSLVTYTDATFGWPVPSFDAMKGTFGSFMPKWPPTAISYPVRIIGGPNSAIVDFIDTKELFGSELHVLGAVDIKDGKIIRWVDYWDGNSFDGNAYEKMRTPSDKFPTDFQEQRLGEDSSSLIRNVSSQLQGAFAKGDSAAAAALFSSEAVYEDRTLNTEILGASAIEQYLSKILPDAPFGKDATLRHVLGSDKGGGFEWVSAGASTHLSGVTALELDSAGKITRLTTVYDGRQLPLETVKKFATLSLEH